ncbi:hypothetical protein [Microbacterium terrisoli]|jgi:hypothetical protein|uniref:hypothetical protein n=1 Tax=Microbacterium terrisoli TaxID=3242192 RepID=UPI0028054683|nr:hypothetical protein [Microbacterium protaetiae]
METKELAAPSGITARMGWAPGSSPTERIRSLAKDALADRLDVDRDNINVDRVAVSRFGHNTTLLPFIGSRELPVVVRTASGRIGSVVAVTEPDRLVGLDIRSRTHNEALLHEIRAHSHLWGDSMWETASDESLLLHWSRVQAVRQADPRGVENRPEHVRLDPPFAKAWTQDGKDAYRLFDLSNQGFIVTLAIGEPAVARV